MQFITKKIKRILKFFGLKLIKYPESSLQQLNFNIIKSSHINYKAYKIYTTRDGKI